MFFNTLPHKERKLTPIQYNGSQYYVAKGSAKKRLKSAKLLAQLETMKLSLCKQLENSRYKSDPGVRRLLSKRKVRIEERSLYYAEEIAYSVNKGEFIGICLESEDINTAFFVLLHELAHIMSKRYDHDSEFWTNFKLLIKAADEFGVYKYVSYNKQPTSFCGTKISHMPYKK